MSNSKAVPFSFNSKEVRVFNLNNEPWFVAKDVCGVLGIKNPTDAIKSLDEDERARFNLGRQGMGNVISESGLYVLIMRSNKPEARPFRKWVTSEVLPTIRKTGGVYLSPEKAEEFISNPETIIKVAQQVIELRAIVESRNLQVEEARPKVELAEAIEASEKSIKIGDYVKVISNQAGFIVGRNNFYKWLRHECIVNRSNMPNQQYIDNGWFEVREGSYENKNTNGPQIFFTTLVTGKGQLSLLKRFKKSDYFQDFLNKNAKANMGLVGQTMATA